MALLHDTWISFWYRMGLLCLLAPACTGDCTHPCTGSRSLSLNLKWLCSIIPRLINSNCNNRLLARKYNCTKLATKPAVIFAQSCCFAGAYPVVKKKMYHNIKSLTCSVSLIIASNKLHLNCRVYGTSLLLFSMMPQSGYCVSTGLGTDLILTSD